MDARRKNRQRNAPHDRGAVETFRVTHPFHPLLGQEFEVIANRSFWGKQRIYFHDPDGRLSAIPQDWTSLAVPDPFVVMAAGRSWFRIDDLLELARWIEGRRDEV